MNESPVPDPSRLVLLIVPRRDPALQRLFTVLSRQIARARAQRQIAEQEASVGTGDTADQTGGGK